MSNILKFIFKSEGKIDRFDFLDCFRGSLVNWVLLHHAYFGFGIYRYFRMTGYYIGVNGFFILSAFLLTYRLLNHFKNEKENSFKNNFLVVLKYSIRRIFRVYFPFVFYVFLIKFESNLKWGGSTQDQPGAYNTFLNITSLQNAGLNHLWTIVR